MVDRVSATELRLNLSATEISGLTGWPDAMTEDYLSILSTFIEFAKSINQLDAVDKQFVMVATDADPPSLPSEINPLVRATIRCRRSSGLYEDYVYEP